MAVLPALASVESLADRLGRSLDDDYARAQAALDDASALVRQEARTDWVDADGAPSAPPAVVAVVLSAALRVMRNPEGFTSETAGPYSYRRSDDAASGVYLTEAERAIIARFRARTGLWTQPLERNELGMSTLWVDDQFGAEPFPIGTVNEYGQEIVP